MCFCLPAAEIGQQMCIFSFQFCTNVRFSAIKIQNKTKIHRKAQQNIAGHESYQLCELLKHQVWPYYYYYFQENRVHAVCFAKVFAKSCPLPRSDLPKIVSYSGCYVSRPILLCIIHFAPFQCGLCLPVVSQLFCPSFRFLLEQSSFCGKLLIYKKQH